MPKLEEQERFSPTDGTRKQYESDWKFAVASGEAVTFTHDLGEIPWSVSIIQSATNDGARAVTATATYTMTDSTVAVSNTGSDDAYFKVRAM